MGAETPQWLTPTLAAMFMWGVAQGLVKTGAYPVVTLAFARAMLRARPSALQWAGTVSVLAGMVLTSVTG